MVAEPSKWSLSILDLSLAILATWRISALLCYDYMFEWLRQKANIDFVDEDGRPITKMGRILSCFWCTSFWVGILVAVLLALGLHWVLLPLAISGGAILMQHWTRLNRDVERWQ